MVSLNTILGVGGIAAAYFIFQGLGGATGIGSRIGGGFTAFSDSLVKSLNPISDLRIATPAELKQSVNPFRDGGYLGRNYDDFLRYQDQGETGEPFIVKNEEKDMKEEQGPSPFDFGQFAQDVLDRFIPSIPSATAQNSTFAGKGMISKGYQEPNYNKPSAGYTSSNFFGGNPNTYVNPWSKS